MKILRLLIIIPLLMLIITTYFLVCCLEFIDRQLKKEQTQVTLVLFLVVASCLYLDYLSYVKV